MEEPPVKHAINFTYESVMKMYGLEHRSSIRDKSTGETRATHVAFMVATDAGLSMTPRTALGVEMRVGNTTFLATTISVIESQRNVDLLGVIGLGYRFKPLERCFTEFALNTSTNNHVPLVYPSARFGFELF